MILIGQTGREDIAIESNFLADLHQGNVVLEGDVVVVLKQLNDKAIDKQYIIDT